MPIVNPFHRASTNFFTPPPIQSHNFGRPASMFAVNSAGAPFAMMNYFNAHANQLQPLAPIADNDANFSHPPAPTHNCPIDIVSLIFLTSRMKLI